VSIPSAIVAEQAILPNRIRNVFVQRTVENDAEKMGENIVRKKTTTEERTWEA